MAAVLAMLLGLLAVPDEASGQSEPVPQFKAAVKFDSFVTYPYGMAVADVMDADGNPGQDGYPELAVVGAGWDLLACGGDASGGLIRVFRNTGTWQTDPANGLVAHWATIIPNSLATEVAFADVSGVNGPDLVVLALYGGGGVLYVFTNQGDGTFSHDPVLWHVPGSPMRGLAVADVDNDGDLDVIAAVNECPAGDPRNRIVVFENTSDPQIGLIAFVPQTITLDIAGDVAPGDVAVGDFFALAAGQPLI
ncbi:MAG TPA: VCBS repeat-containing protein, partial [Phycisphaerales bacterium]|nr:VCBS repeat-containing protein [Phycisphaerales bacterium]